MNKILSKCLILIIMKLIFINMGLRTPLFCAPSNVGGDDSKLGWPQFPFDRKKGRYPSETLFRCPIRGPK